MVIRGYERATGSFFVTLTGIANVIGRVIGAFIRFFVKSVTVAGIAYIVFTLNIRTGMLELRV